MFKTNPGILKDGLIQPKAKVRTYDRKCNDIKHLCILLYAASSVAYMVIGVSLFFVKVFRERIADYVILQV